MPSSEREFKLNGKVVFTASFVAPDVKQMVQAGLMAKRLTWDLLRQGSFVLRLGHASMPDYLLKQVHPCPPHHITCGAHHPCSLLDVLVPSFPRFLVPSDLTLLPLASPYTHPTHRPTPLPKAIHTLIDEDVKTNAAARCDIMIEHYWRVRGVPGALHYSQVLHRMLQRHNLRLPLTCAGNADAPITSCCLPSEILCLFYPSFFSMWLHTHVSYPPCLIIYPFVYLLTPCLFISLMCALVSVCGFPLSRTRL